MVSEGGEAWRASMCVVVVVSLWLMSMMLLLSVGLGEPWCSPAHHK